MVAEGMQVAPVNFEKSRRSLEERGGTIGRRRGSSITDAVRKGCVNRAFLNVRTESVVE